jgi:hypothetical protein
VIACCPKSVLGLILLDLINGDVIILLCLVVLMLAALAWILLMVFRRH